MTKMAQLTLPLDHTPCYGRDSFFVGPHNSLAYEALCGPSAARARVSFLWGDAGCGKTHLAHIWAQDHGSTFLDKARLAQQTLMEEVEQAKALVLEDMEDLSAYEEALFHLLNIVKELGKPLLLTSNVRAQDLSFVLPDLRSRLLALPAFHIDAADDQSRTAYLYKCFSDRQIKVTASLVQDILARTPRGFHDLARVVSRLCEASLRTKKAPSRQLLKEILEEGTPLAP
ncbi:MAG: DNA replication protein [Proteobacteria bacterium]|nr:DNA replication protein [Pseudomonadota bacterium]